MINPYRAMVVDDSAVVRGFITRMLEKAGDIKVAFSANNGDMALKHIKTVRPEVVVLDVNMPGRDGIELLPELIAQVPDVKVIMASALTLQGADVTVRALAAGAADYIPKPSSLAGSVGAQSFEQELVGKVRALASTVRKRRGEAPPSEPEEAPEASTPPTGAPAPAAPAVAPSARPARPASVAPRWPADKVVQAPVLRTAPIKRPDIIAIGSSTGGPQALFEVVKHIRDVAQPILITQHMPPTFTKILAEHIGRHCTVRCAEAKDGEPLVGGRVYLAPGGIHMVVDTVDGVPRVCLRDDPPENFCKPAVDPLFRSLAGLRNKTILAVVLTGMGRDGTAGARTLIDSGHSLIAQDEASSVVWGMPGSVANAGLCSAILPIDEIGPFVRRLATGGVA